MANCKYCGRWAGIASDKHDSCDVAAKANAGVEEKMTAIRIPLPPPFDARALAAELRPILYGAGWRAGISAAITLVAVGIAFAVIRFVFSLA